MRKIALMAMLLAGCAESDLTNSITQKLPNGGVCEETPSGCECQGSPIVVDLTGAGFDISGPDNPVTFPLISDMSRPWSWPNRGSSVAFLWLDRNGDGLVTGSELFGDSTLQQAAPQPGDGDPRPNGFRALSVFDQNHDLKIDSADAVYGQLKLWIDRNRDGTITPGDPAEVIALPVSGILSIDLRYRSSTKIDANGNEYRFSSTVTTRPGSTIAPTIYDVFLLTVNPTDVPTVSEKTVKLSDGTDVLVEHSNQTVVDPNTPIGQSYNTTTCWLWTYSQSTFGSACDSAGTSGDPVVSWAVTGRATPFWKLIVRQSTATNSPDQFVLEGAKFFVDQARETCTVGHEVGGVTSIAGPTPDIYRTGGGWGGYTRDGKAYRARCETTTHTGGGTSPGGPAC